MTEELSMMNSEFKIKDGVLIRYLGTEKHVVIPDGITKIVGRAFEGCKRLQSVEIPESVTEIGPTVFATCRNLRSVTIPKGLKKLGPYAFVTCESLERIDLSSKLRIINENTFEGCTSLESVILPSTLAKIDRNAFRNCTNLSSINFPEDLAEICRGAFLGCRKLRTDRKPGYPVRVWDGAFIYSDPSIVEVLTRIPRQRAEVPGGIYKACIVTITNLRRHQNADRLQCTEIDGCNVVVDLSCEIGQKMVFFPVGGQLDETFARENHLLRGIDENGNPGGGYLDSRKRVIKPLDFRGEISEGLLLPVEVLSKYTDTAKLVDGFRFSSLNGVEICRFYPVKMLSIDEKTGRLGDFASGDFRGTTLRIPYGVTAIDRRAFRDDSSLKTVIIPSSVKEIGTEAFTGAAVENVVLPEGLWRIGDYAFAGCHNLKSIVIPGSVEIIDRYAFYRCDGLQELTIMNGVKYIGENAFEKCRQVKRVDVPDSVLKIGVEAFVGCADTEHIRIPEKVKVIGETYGATPMENLTVERYNLEFAFVDDVVFSKDMTELIKYPPQKTGERYTVPDCVRKIKDNAFFGNMHLNEVIISNGVTHIGHRAFENCKNLRCVTIPPSVIDMGNFVFIGIHNVPNRNQVRISGDIGKASVKSIIEALNSIGVEEGVLIRGKKGSEAERYAVREGCAFESY